MEILSLEELGKGAGLQAWIKNVDFTRDFPLKMVKSMLTRLFL